MPRQKKDATTRPQRTMFARRVMAVVLSRHPTLYKFQQAYPTLEKRVDSWTLPQRKKRLTNADYDDVVVPDGLSLREFCQATGASADWLLGLRGVDDVPEFTDVARPLATLADDLAQYVKTEVQARVKARPVEGFNSHCVGPLTATDGAGARLLAQAVASAESALRAWQPVYEERAIVAQAATAAWQYLAVHPGKATSVVTRASAALADRLQQMQGSSATAEQPPVTFTATARRVAKV